MATKSPAESALTPEQAKILLRADLKNLAAKVQKGKTLSVSERNLLNSTLAGSPSPVTFAKNQVELAEALKVSRKTIERKKKLPGAPKPHPDGRHDVAAWREFLLHNNSHVTIEGAEHLSHTELKCRQILLQNEKLEFQLAILRKEFVSAADVKRDVAEICLQAKKVLLQIPPSFAPQVVGLSVADAEIRLREAVDEALAQLHANPL